MHREHLPAHQHHAGCGCYQPPGPTVYQPVPLDQPSPPTGGPCAHPYPYPPQPYPGIPPQGGAGPVVAKWIGIGIGSGFLAVSLAVSAVAVAISAVALTTCVLILRSVWSETKKGQ